VEVPLDVTRECLLGKRPHWIRFGAVDAHFGHERAALTLSWKALAPYEIRHLFGRKLLPAELVARIQKNLDLLSICIVPTFELLVDAVCEASAGGDIDHERRLATRIREWQVGACH